MHWKARRCAFSALMLLGLVAARAAAQGRPETGLPVTGSLAFNLLFYRSPSDVSVGPGGFTNGRFHGRVAVRVARRTYVGLGVGSWARAVTEATYGDLAIVSSLSEAVVLQAYVQHYPLRALPWFVRGGTGIAHTYTVQPAGRVMIGRRHWRGPASVGSGVDLRVGGPLHLTASADYTILPAVRSGATELRSAWALGAAITLR